jgi:zinc transporter, ZIP family
MPSEFQVILPFVLMAAGAGIVGGILALFWAPGMFFLNLSVGTEFHKQKSKHLQGLAVNSAIAVLLLLGSVAGFLVLRGLSEGTVAVFLAFGAAALIYLVAEELLVESIEAEESLFSTALLFAGFLVVLAFKLVGPTWSSATS